MHTNMFAYLQAYIICVSHIEPTIIIYEERLYIDCWNLNHNQLYASLITAQTTITSVTLLSIVDSYLSSEIVNKPNHMYVIWSEYCSSMYGIVRELYNIHSLREGRGKSVELSVVMMADVPVMTFSLNVTRRYVSLHTLYSWCVHPSWSQSVFF
jgi:PKD repeat protein